MRPINRVALSTEVHVFQGRLLSKAQECLQSPLVCHLGDAGVSDATALSHAPPEYHGLQYSEYKKGFGSSIT